LHAFDIMAVSCRRLRMSSFAGITFIFLIYRRFYVLTDRTRYNGGPRGPPTFRRF
jgi:hypothetical protein